MKLPRATYQNRKSGDAIATSDLPPKADIKQLSPEIRKVPICDIARNECSEARVAAIVNMSPAMVHHYSKKVGQFRLACAAMEQFEAGWKKLLPSVLGNLKIAK